MFTQKMKETSLWMTFSMISFRFRGINKMPRLYKSLKSFIKGNWLGSEMTANIKIWRSQLRKKELKEVRLRNKWNWSMRKWSNRKITSVNKSKWLIHLNMNIRNYKKLNSKTRRWYSYLWVNKILFNRVLIWNNNQFLIIIRNLVNNQ